MIVNIINYRLMKYWNKVGGCSHILTHQDDLYRKNNRIIKDSIPFSISKSRIKMVSSNAT